MYVVLMIAPINLCCRRKSEREQGTIGERENCDFSPSVHIPMPISKHMRVSPFKDQTEQPFCRHCQCCCFWHISKKNDLGQFISDLRYLTNGSLNSSHLNLIGCLWICHRWREGAGLDGEYWRSWSSRTGEFCFPSGCSLNFLQSQQVQSFQKRYL